MNASALIERDEPEIVKTVEDILVLITDRLKALEHGMQRHEFDLVDIKANIKAIDVFIEELCEEK